MNENNQYIADTYGLEKQLKQLIEESAELIQAISKCQRYGCGTVTKRHLFEEIGDVKLLLDHVIYLMDCEEDVQASINYKIHRELGRSNDRRSGKE